ncbi:MAG: hypothetical protein NZ578_15130, partial [Candidatus Binatia bacterium]|nr:hypothetical protein [Candidatus Binatia bacterium]
QGLSVRETESLVARLPRGSSRPTLSPAAEQDPPPPGEEPKLQPNLHLRAIEEELLHALGTKVRIAPRKKGGRIEIEYYSDEQLQSLVHRLRGARESETKL